MTRPSPPLPPPRRRSLQRLSTASFPDLTTLFSTSNGTIKHPPTYLTTPSPSSRKTLPPLPPPPPSRRHSHAPTPSAKLVTNPFRNPTLLRMRLNQDNEENAQLPPNVSPTIEWWDKASMLTDVGARSQLAFLRRKSIGEIPSIFSFPPRMATTPPISSELGDDTSSIDSLIQFETPKPSPTEATFPDTTNTIRKTPHLPPLPSPPHHALPVQPIVPIPIFWGSGITVTLHPPTPSPPLEQERRKSWDVGALGKEWWEIETEQERAVREARGREEGKWLMVPEFEQEETVVEEGDLRSDDNEEEEVGEEWEEYEEGSREGYVEEEEDENGFEDGYEGMGEGDDKIGGRSEWDKVLEM